MLLTTIFVRTFHLFDIYLSNLIIVIINNHTHTQIERRAFQQLPLPQKNRIKTGKTQINYVNEF